MVRIKKFLLIGALLSVSAPLCAMNVDLPTPDQNAISSMRLALMQARGVISPGTGNAITPTANTTSPLPISSPFTEEAVQKAALRAEMLDSDDNLDRYLDEFTPFPGQACSPSPVPSYNGEESLISQDLTEGSRATTPQGSLDDLPAMPVMTALKDPVELRKYVEAVYRKIGTNDPETLETAKQILTLLDSLQNLKAGHIGPAIQNLMAELEALTIPGGDQPSSATYQRPGTPTNKRIPDPLANTKLLVSPGAHTSAFGSPAQKGKKSDESSCASFQTHRPGRSAAQGNKTSCWKKLKDGSVVTDDEG